MGHHSAFIFAFAGTCFFMLGMSLASENLQDLAANRIRDIINKLAKRPVMGIFAGILVTILIQSSGAVTSMLVGLGSAGVISLSQVMGIILGTGIGTTLTVQLLSLNIAQFGLPIFAFSFTVYFLSSRPTLRRVMGAVMGFGLIFWGLEMIGWGTSALREVESFTAGLGYIKESPMLLLFSATAITALVHSSAVTIGFAMSLATSGLIDLTSALYIVYGANLGTTATALIASAGGNYVGKQIAWAHCFYKALLCGLFFYFTPHVVELIGTNLPARDVANAHLLFNVAGAILFFPFIQQGAKLVESVITPGPNDREFSAKYLDRLNFDTPSVVLAHAEREIMRMSDIVYSMIKDIKKALRNLDVDLIEDIQARDNKVDLLNREISLFLTRKFDDQSGHAYHSMIRYVTFASDLESAADVVENSILQLAQKKHNLKLDFSEEGWQEIEKLHAEALELFSISVSCFQTQKKDLAAQVVYQKRAFRKEERRLKETHIERLAKGKDESIRTSSIHLDLLGDYRRIVGLMSNHVYEYLKDTDKYNIMPRRESKDS